MYSCVAVCLGEVLDAETLRRVLLYNKGAGCARPLEIRFVPVDQNADARGIARKSMRKERIAYVPLYDSHGTTNGEFLYAY